MLCILQGAEVDEDIFGDTDDIFGGVAAGPPAVAPVEAPPMPPPPMPPPVFGPEVPEPPRPLSEAGSSIGDGGGKALASVGIGRGRIDFFAGGRFQALCQMKGRVRCRLTRYMPKTAAPKDAAAGRMCGHLGAWLCLQGIETQTEHRNPWIIMGISKADRCRARADIKAKPGGLALLGNERRKRDGEDSEPELCS